MDQRATAGERPKGSDAKPSTIAPPNARLAIYIDADNAIACLTSAGLVRLCEFLERFGHIQSVRAYGDWEQLGGTLRDTGRFAVQPVHLPTNGVRRKNGVDIALAVDVIDDLHLAPGIDTFVLVSGDGDLAPVAMRLRQRGRRVIGLGRKSMTSCYLKRACDTFIMLESIGIGVDSSKADSPLAQTVLAALRADADAVAAVDPLPADLFEAFERSIIALERSAGPHAPIEVSQLKQELLQHHSTFREKEFGAQRFTDFLARHAEALGIEVYRTRGNAMYVARLAGNGRAPIALSGEVTFDVEDIPF